MKLDVEAARSGIEERIARPLQVDFIQAVWGIHDLINETMAAAAKTHIAEKGGNPKVVTLAAFGGAGPVHAYGLARKLGAPRILVPPNAGVGSALGFFTAPRAFDLVRSHKVSLADADLDDIESIFSNLESDGTRTLEKSGAREEITFERSVDVRFVGQGSETNIPVPSSDFREVDKQWIRDSFDGIYRKLYGRTYPDSPVEFVNFKVRARLPERLLELPERAPGKGTLENAKKGTRDAYSGIAGTFIPHAVYDRYRLEPGATFRGPAIIEERESTVIAGEDTTVKVDGHGFIWMQIGEV
jgi:N-methylhydantoinase A/oxoprolinase/acetone carboxylase beta subunit